MNVEKTTSKKAKRTKAKQAPSTQHPHIADYRKKKQPDNSLKKEAKE